VPLARLPLRRAIGAVTAILVFILLLGATYQGVATALERREFARPGGLVSVGDHQLHIYCTGRGTPSVVLEAPAAGLSAAWADVQRQLSAVTRVCSYDRAGLGWSESGDRPFDPDVVPGELRTLLTRANVPGPFVVVGHGLGAAFARMYAARPDADAVALVLVDPPAGSTAMQPGWIMPASPWLARTGVLRAGRILSSRADGLAGGGALQAFLNRPDHLARAADELLAWNDLVQQTAGLQPASSRTRVMTVDLRTGDRIAFLTNPAAVDRVVAAIRAAMTSPRG
jgi:pimeloyl-ACP methyl ester carboxylesterase